MFGKIGLAFGLFFTTASFAGVQVFNSSDTSLGIHNKLKCGTGITCSVSGGKLGMSAVLDPAVVGAEAGNATLTLSADESDDNGDDWKVVSNASTNSLTFTNDTSGSDVAKVTVTTGGNVSLVGTLTGDGGDALSGFLTKQVAATATSITAVQCGSSFINSGAVVMALPEASTVLGCRLTFIVGNASNFDINPDDADIILPFSSITPSAGDAVRSATVGVSVTLEAISASQWAVVGQNGAWTDIN